MKRIYTLLLLLLIGVFQIIVASDKKTVADKAYQDNNFKMAITVYNKILEEGKESSALYYNLGNSYYKLDSLGKAIISYERALLLNPEDEDIIFNLKMARSKTIDKITPKREIFIVTWVRDLRLIFTESEWAIIAIISFLIVLFGCAIYVFSKKILLKKIGFTFAIICFVLTIMAHLFAKQQKNILIERKNAIVVCPTVTVRSTPNESGTELFVVHEGAKLFIEDNSMSSWKEVSLADGNRGWIPESAIEVI